VVVERAAVNLSALSQASSGPSASALSIFIQPGAPAAVADYSPPPGKSILRI
jgi:hypothetical protein